ncbi:hypothetical protein OAX78_01585 [Planctomycetota bacterium]|nr:hypothetical protein [Planctomycetota bacterium]
MIRPGLHVRASKLRCPLCHDHLDPADVHVRGVGCLTRYHESCAAELGGCALLGCGQANMVRGRTDRRPVAPTWRLQGASAVALWSGVVALGLAWLAVVDSHLWGVLAAMPLIGLGTVNAYLEVNRLRSSNERTVLASALPVVGAMGLAAVVYGLSELFSEDSGLSWLTIVAAVAGLPALDALLEWDRESADEMSGA